MKTAFVVLMLTCCIGGGFVLSPFLMVIFFKLISLLA